jgi:outer membrane protein assembly factor BamB
VGDNSSGLVTEETVYVPATTVVDAVGVDGTERWRYEGSKYQYGTLSVAGDTVVFTTGSSPEEWTIRGLDAATGEQRWTFDDWTAYTTRTDGDRLFVGGEAVARLDPASGDVLWTAAQQAALYDAPVADGRLYAAGEGAAAIDVDDGTVHWQTPLDALLVSPVGLAGGHLILHESRSRDDRDRHVSALDAESGEQAWRFAGDAALTTPTVAGDRVYVAEDSDVLALRG